jgi:hypothetical protein
VKALEFFHLPISQTSSEEKPRLLYIATPAPLVECAFHTLVSMPKFANDCFVKLPMELAFRGTNGGFKEMNTGDPGGTLLAVKATYLLNKVQGHKLGTSGTVPLRSQTTLSLHQNERLLLYKRNLSEHSFQINVPAKHKEPACQQQSETHMLNRMPIQRHASKLFNRCLCIVK